MTNIGMVEVVQNDFLIILDFFLLILFARYVWYRIVDQGAFGWWDAFSRPATKVGWALMLTYASRWIDRISFLFWTHHYTRLSHVTGVSALVLAVWSAACVVRVFAGTTWGPRAWIWIVGLAVGFSIAMIAFPNF